MSSPSCSISASNSPLPSRPSPSPPPNGSSPSDSTADRIPLAQRRLIRGPPTGGPPAREQGSGRGRTRGVGSSVTAVGESPEFTASITSGQDIFKLVMMYRVPKDIHTFRPDPKDRAAASRPGRVALYEAFFKAGLRLPLHPFIVNLLDRYRLVPAQLVPNSIRTIIGFLVLCHREGIEATLSLFRCFYTLRKQGEWWSFAPRPTRALKLFLPTSIKGWKNRFFFADLKEVKGTWGVPDISANQSSFVPPQEREAFDKLLTADIPPCSWLLSKESLEHAGLLPHSDEMFTYQEMRAAATRNRKKEADAKRRDEAEIRKAEVGRVSGAQTAKTKEAETKRQKRAIIKIARTEEAEPPSKKPRPPSPPTCPANEPAGETAPIDLTAESPPEGPGMETQPSPPIIPGGEVAEVSTEPGPSMVPSAIGPATERPMTRPTETPAIAPNEGPLPHAGTEEEVEAAATTLGSLLNKGKWAERVMSRVSLPETQQSLLERSSSEFYREAFASMFWLSNSFISLKAVLGQAETAVVAARCEADATRTQLEEVEQTLGMVRAAEDNARLALEEAQHQVKEAEEELQKAKGKLKEAEGELYTQEGQIFDLRAQTQEAKEQANNAVQLARYADARAETLAKEVEELKAKAAEEAKRAIAETDKRIAEAVAAFRQSDVYKKEVLDTTSFAYDLGFKDCQLKARQVSSLEEIEGLEPDSVEDPAPSSPGERAHIDTSPPAGP